jgi:hypothetical protein
MVQEARDASRRAHNKQRTAPSTSKAQWNLAKIGGLPMLQHLLRLVAS